MYKSLVKNALKFVGLAVGLAVFGVACGFLFAFIGGAIVGGGDFGALGLAFLGLLIGYFFGIMLGIVLIKKWLKQPGSLTLGIVGSIIGAVLTVLIGVAFDPGATFLFSVLFFTTPVFGLAGFYMRRLKQTS